MTSERPPGSRRPLPRRLLPRRLSQEGAYGFRKMAPAKTAIKKATAAKKAAGARKNRSPGGRR
ncbi:hypothetical protein E4K10_23070 [Streptomyces sp. T1317-0309]|nr:hypothetical protein E4K10_23070 [Streptomyces sp. T1317-0309]